MEPDDYGEGPNDGSIGIELIAGLAILLVAYGIKQAWEFFHG